MLFPRWALAAILALASATGASGSNACIQVTSWDQFTAVLSSIGTDEKTAVFCPFRIRHDGGRRDGYDIAVEDLNLMCSESDISSNNPSSCIIEGTARHLNILDNQITLVGFGFQDSNHGAVRVSEGTEGTSFVKCSFQHNSRLDGDGGAIELAPQSYALISQSTFLLNSASGGGAISGILADLSVHGSSFLRNKALAGTGGAINMVSESSKTNEVDDGDEGRRRLEQSSDEIQSYGGEQQHRRDLKKGRSEMNSELTHSRLYVKNSDFTSNSAEIAGPAIFAAASSMDGGSGAGGNYGIYSGNSNYGCSNFVFGDSAMCNGYSDGIGDCSSFKTTCGGENSGQAQSRVEGGSSGSFSDSFDAAVPLESDEVDLLVDPTPQPVPSPTSIPTAEPTASPSFEPTAEGCLGERCDYGNCCENFVCSRSKKGVCIHAPTQEPSSLPSMPPTVTPSTAPSQKPSTRPSSSPSANPSTRPSSSPSANPSTRPSSSPSANPSAEPSVTPTGSPSSTPSSAPSPTPTSAPSSPPPTSTPSSSPSSTPSSAPTASPSFLPSSVPSSEPTKHVTCGMNPLMRHDAIMDVLGTVSDPIQLRYSSLPQGQAAGWLIFDDAMMLCPDDDNIIQRYVMAVFYFSTGGDDWLTCSSDPTKTDCPGFYSERFLSDYHECTWAGITCPNGVDSITTIAFENNGLVGSIPTELSALSELKTLRLEHGQLKGEIPASLGTLSHLEKLDLDFNALTGTIPQALSQATNLQLLDLNDNALVGSIDVLANFPDLFFVQLHSNEFSGSIVEELGTLTDLRVFSVHDTNIEGVMPFSFCNLRQYGELDVLQADCAGPDPKVGCICCTKCYPLPPTPSPIGGDGGNRVDVPVTAAPSQSPTTAPTQEPTTSPTEFPSSVPSLAPTTTPAPTTKCQVDHNIRSQQIIDILSSVSSQSDLLNEGTPQALALKWILFDDEMELCPDDSGLIQRYVTALFYYSTNGDSWFDKGSGNEEYLGPYSECQWKGLTCSGAGIITHVQFEKNGLSGTIPNEISVLDQTQVLSLERGSLTNTIPTTIGNMKALQKLDLDYNDLTGELPSNLWEAKSLKVLDLNANRLSGGISVLTGFRGGIEFIQLHNNKFSGPLPNALGLLKGLEVMTLHKTDLTGVMPFMVCNNVEPLGSITHLWADCEGSYPKVDCSCCTKCFS